MMQDLVRGALILICGMMLFNLPTLIYKIRLAARTFMYFCFCFDKSWKKPQDPGSVFGPHLTQGLPVERRTIYFIRHAESTWNETFNKGAHRSHTQFIVGFIPGLITALTHELYLLLSGKHDSWFYDSPLSFLGFSQVMELTQFLKAATTQQPGISEEEQKHVSILTGQPASPPSQIVCSPLRRAVSTLAGCLHDRLHRHAEEKILILPCLQEVSRNPDTLVITPPHTPIQASWIEQSGAQDHLLDYQEAYYSQVDMSLFTGDKPLNSNGLKRMLEFCDNIFDPSIVKEKNVLVGGHSLWFRYFFKTFLPYSVHHVSKEKKVVNCGVVAFDLMKAETSKGPKYMIDPKSLYVVHGGFN